MTSELTPAEIEQRRQATASHGAHSYAARLANGELISVAMGLCESAVLARLAEGGPRAMVRYGCEQLAVQAELIRRHLEGAASPEDAERLLTLLNKFTSRSVDAWAKYAELPSPDGGAIDYEKVVEAQRNAEHTAD